MQNVWLLLDRTSHGGKNSTMVFPILVSDRADSRLVPSQWEAPLQSNAISHWLGANLESALSEQGYVVCNALQASNRCFGNLVIRLRQTILNRILFKFLKPEDPYMCRADSRFAPSQWETALLCNDVSHWLGASLESAMYVSVNWIIIAPCNGIFSMWC